MPVLDIEKVDRLKQILKWHPRGVTISDLAAKMDMNRNLVAKYLDMLLISGQVDMEVVGAAKVYFLSRRVPISSMLEFSSDMVIVLDSEQKSFRSMILFSRTLREKKDALVGRTSQRYRQSFFQGGSHYRGLQKTQIPSGRFARWSARLRERNTTFA